MGMGMTLFMEAFVTIHMSVFVLLPLSKLISKDNSRKIFWTFFCLLASSYIGIIKCFPGVISHKIGNREIPAEHKKEKEGQLNYNRLF